MSQSDEDFQLTKTIAERNVVINKVFELAQTQPYNIVKKYMEENSIPINVKNLRGLSLLYIAIDSKNQSVIEGCIQDKIDLHTKASFSFYEIYPIHFALLSCNKDAVNALVNAGVNIRESDDTVEESAAIAVKFDAVDSVKMLMEMGVDFSTVEVKMAWSPTLTAYDYAKSKNRKKLMKVFGIEE